MAIWLSFVLTVLRSLLGDWFSSETEVSLSWSLSKVRIEMYFTSQQDHTIIHTIHTLNLHVCKNRACMMYSHGFCLTGGTRVSPEDAHKLQTVWRLHVALASLEGDFKGIELDLPTNTFLKCDFVYKDAEGSSWAYDPRARAVHRNQRMREDTLNNSRCHCQFDPRIFHAAFWIMACLWEWSR